MSRLPGTEGYAAAAPHLIATRLPFDQVHAPILPLIPKAPARILDVGAGAGHEAATLAGMGHEVVAAEPTPELLAGAVGLYGSEKVRWIADGLPDLAGVEGAFDFILASAVWMHLDAPERRAAMHRVASLLAPGGVLALSLRHGPVPPGRRMFEVPAAETTALAVENGLAPVLEAKRGSVQPANRAAGVTWTFLAFQA